MIGYSFGEYIAACIAGVFTLPGALFIEIGPGRDLSILLKQYIHTNPKERIIDTIRHPKKEISDLDFLVTKVSHLAQSIEDPGVEAFEL